jgi:hypothetical protein
MMKGPPDMELPASVEALSGSRDPRGVVIEPLGCRGTC